MVQVSDDDCNVKCIFNNADTIPDYMGIERIINKVKSIQGVMTVFNLDCDRAKIVLSEEGKVGSSSGIPMDNIALDMCIGRQYLLCLLVNREFKFPESSFVSLTDSEGQIIGHDVPASRIPEYKDRDDIIWLSDDFVMSTKHMGSSEMRVRMMPIMVDFLGPNDDVKECSAMSPSPSTDVLLKDMLGLPKNNPDMFTVLLSFNVSTVCSKRKVPSASENIRS